MSDAQAVETIPTQAMPALLDAYGLQATWVSLLAALAGNSFTHEAARKILASAEFVAATPVPNLLHQLSIGQIGVLYEFSLAYVDRAARKEAGQYFTPDDMSQFLAARSDSFQADATWLDPCAGVGNLAYWLIARQGDPEHFLLNRLYCADLDPTALLIARTFFTLVFYRQEVDLFNLLRERFITGDFLTLDLPAYDYALLNPPYAARPADDRFETGEARDLYAYFLEQVMRTARGFISITPQSFTNSVKFRSFRRLLTTKYAWIAIYIFDNMPSSIFRGIKFGSTNTNTKNSTRAGIIVAHEADVQNWRITSMLRWVSTDRARLLAEADRFLVPVKLGEDKFAKVPIFGGDFYKKLTSEGWVRLESLLSPTPTEHTLTVPASPRYFLGATKRTLARSSFHTLYFSTQASLDEAYVLLNSSLAYFWWRVNDDGMMLSRETLLSVPVPPQLLGAEGLDEFVSGLEVGEITNLVIKMNAGKAAENVKQPIDIISKINAYLFGTQLDSRLRALATNSDLELLPQDLTD